MSRRQYLDDEGSPEERERQRQDEETEDLRRERAEVDRRSWERTRDMTRDNQRSPEHPFGSVGGSTEGGVFSAGTYGSGAEYYSITGMYDNPLLEHKHHKHRGKGPRGYIRSDDRIYDDVCDRLTQHPLIDATHMEVTVKNGEVTLEGEIQDRRMKHMAENVADSVSGVKDIHNLLRIHRKDAA